MSFETGSYCCFVTLVKSTNKGDLQWFSTFLSSKYSCSVVYKCQTIWNCEKERVLQWVSGWWWRSAEDLPRVFLVEKQPGCDATINHVACFTALYTGLYDAGLAQNITKDEASPTVLVRVQPTMYDVYFYPKQVNLNSVCKVQLLNCGSLWGATVESVLC